MGSRGEGRGEKRRHKEKKEGEGGPPQERHRNDREGHRNDREGAQEEGKSSRTGRLSTNKKKKEGGDHK